MRRRVVNTEMMKDAIRSYCVRCLGLSKFNEDIIKKCCGEDSLYHPCPLYPYRLGKRPDIKAFWATCLLCKGGSYVGVERCKAETCPLFPYRFGIKENESMEE